jgi:hypothetical protein
VTPCAQSQAAWPFIKTCRSDPTLADIGRVRRWFATRHRPEQNFASDRRG